MTTMGAIFGCPPLADNCRVAFYTDRNYCIAPGQATSCQRPPRPIISGNSHPNDRRYFEICRKGNSRSSVIAVNSNEVYPEIPV